MLAYLFWHSPGEQVATEAYERALRSFHESLASDPPVGFLGSHCYRAAALPWLQGTAGGYEDWYLVEDYAALGVLSETATGLVHRPAHDLAARGTSTGTAGLYRLCEGSPGPGVSLAIWVTPARQSPQDSVEALLLGDGADSGHIGLWRRELTLSPAPEYCLLTSEPPAGISPARLPAGWIADTSPREAI